MSTLQPRINRKEYPELDLILWDYAGEEIDASEAFSRYERRWRYVDQNRLSAKERAFIARLTDEYGNGVFFSA